VHCRFLQSLSLLRGIFRVMLPPPCWDLWILDSSESCLYHLGLFCAAFCGRTIFLSTLAISGLSSFSWTSNACMIVLISQVDFWIINQCCICNCVMYPHIRWSWEHISFRVSFSGVLCWVSTRPSHMRYVWYRCIFVSPQHSAELFWQRVLIR
jgi:hypothetical protein